MATYKAIKESQTYYKNFTSLMEAESYFLTELGWDWLVLEASPEEQIPEPSVEELVRRDLEFGKMMIFEFLKDEKTQTRTPQESALIGAKLFNTQYMLNNGAIIAAKAELETVTTDSLFTDALKNKYITMFNQYLGI